MIYQYALKHIPKELCAELYKQYTIHEKKFGDRAAIEDVIVSKRRFQYENEIEANPHNYDVWFDYLRLMEAEGDKEGTQVRIFKPRLILTIMFRSIVLL